MVNAAFVLLFKSFKFQWQTHTFDVYSLYAKLCIKILFSNLYDIVCILSLVLFNTIAYFLSENVPFKLKEGRKLLHDPDESNDNNDESDQGI